MGLNIFKNSIILFTVTVGFNAANVTLVLADDSSFISNVIMTSHNTGNQSSRGEDGKDGEPGKDGQPGRDGESVINTGRSGAGVNITNTGSIEDDSLIRTIRSSSFDVRESQSEANHLVPPKAIDTELRQNQKEDNLENRFVNKDLEFDPGPLIDAPDFSSRDNPLLKKLILFVSNQANQIDTNYLPLQYNNLLWKLILFAYDK